MADIGTDHIVEVRSNHVRAVRLEGVTDFAKRGRLLALGRVGFDKQRKDFGLSATRRSSLVRSPSTFLGGLCLTFGGSSLFGRCCFSVAARQRRRIVRLLPKEGDHIGALLRVRNAGEGHGGAGCEGLRVRKPLVQTLVGPSATLVLESRGVAEVLVMADIGTDHIVEVRSNHVRAVRLERVADFAKRGRLLALGRIGFGEKRKDFGLSATRRSSSVRGLSTFLGSRLGCWLRNWLRAIAVLIQIGDHVGALLQVRNAGESHACPRGEGLRVRKPMIQSLERPLAVMPFESGGVGKALVRRDLVADNAIEVGTDHVRSTLLEAVANLAEPDGLLAFGRVGLVQRHNERCALVSALLLVAVRGFALGSSDFVARSRRLMLFIHDVDECSRAKEEQQRQKHRHGDFVKVVIFHIRFPPAGKRLLQGSSCDAG